jgi:hypothetical protein
LELKKNGDKQKKSKGDKMRIVYLSGKMTGLAESEYKENFRNAEMFYRACGYEVVNPCNLSEIVLQRKPDATYEDFMREDFKAISGCTHIALLEGWESRTGAKRERAEAERLGLEVMYYRTVGGKK